MKIVQFTEEYCTEIVNLFFEVVHNIDSSNYSKTQLEAWTGNNRNEINDTQWCDKFRKSYTLIALHNNKVIGFGNLADGNYIDTLFVSSRFQKQGLGETILEELEREGKKLGATSFYADVSIPAKSFFAKHGYAVEKKQTQVRHGVELENFRMIKDENKSEIKIDQ